MWRALRPLHPCIAIALRAATCHAIPLAGALPRLREIIPTGAWHALRPDPLTAAAAEPEGEAAAALPPYVRSRLRLLAGDVDRSVRPSPGALPCLTLCRAMNR